MSEKRESGLPKQAAKRTIVGGQPPGNGRPLEQIPEGIEQVLALAAVDAEFARALHERREQALEGSGVLLTATERQVLQSVPPGALAQMVAKVDRAIRCLPPPGGRMPLGWAATCST